MGFLLCLLMFSGMAFSQTYYYKVLYKVNPSTGERKEASGGFYVTFTNNKQNCYESDSEGFQINYFSSNKFLTPQATYMSALGPGTTESTGVYTYHQRNSKVVTYKLAVSYSYPQPMTLSRTTTTGYWYVSFSPDYSRVNAGDKDIIVGERSYEPGSAPTPSSMY